MGLLKIGEVAAQAGVSSRTVDFYTGMGLIEASARTAGNFRLYDASVVDRIAAVRRLEANGVSLDDIARALSGPADLAAQLSRLDGDLQALREASARAGEEAGVLLAAITARVHSLITAAIEIAAGLPPA
jgi:MerR family copper efflux transcriptional regulator